MSLKHLETLRGEMKKCVRCSLCKLVPMPTIQQTRFTSACPPVDEYHFHAYSGGGLQVMALSLLDGRITVDQDLADIVSACTTCGACDVSCKFIMAAERGDVIMALKEHVVESGFGIQSHNGTRTAQSKWSDGANCSTVPDSKSDILLFVGAGVDYDPQHASAARKLALLLKHSHVDFVILRAPELDSGIEAYWRGQRQDFLNQAQEVVHKLNGSGSKIIITLCGEDLGMLRSIYPRYNLTIRAEVLHASEILAQLIRNGKLQLTNRFQKTVTYHDPCYLGRRSEPPQDWEGEERQTHGVMRYFVPPKPINYGVNGVYDPPRQLLSAVPGIHFVEMHRIREYAYCCGGGGGVPDAHPEVARNAAAQRLDEARDVGAEMLVTACQHCRRNMTQSQKDEPMPVVDLIDLVYEAAGLGKSDE